LLLSVSPPFWDSEDDKDPVILEIVSEEREKLPPAMFVDFGPPLPSRYGVDQLELMLQNPLRVFAYWELREATILTALQGHSRSGPPKFSTPLKVEGKGWPGTRLDREPPTIGGSDTLPESRYQLELGLYWGRSMAGFLCSLR
jgi:hypothetical protein